MQPISSFGNTINLLAGVSVYFSFEYTWWVYYLSFLCLFGISNLEHRKTGQRLQTKAPFLTWQPVYSRADSKKPPPLNLESYTRRSQLGDYVSHCEHSCQVLQLINQKAETTPGLYQVLHGLLERIGFPVGDW